MNGITHHTTTAAKVRAHSNSPGRPGRGRGAARRIPAHVPSAIRPEMLEVLRNGAWLNDSGLERQNYQGAFDRLIGLLGRSPEMAVVSSCIAGNVARHIGDRDSRGWRWPRRDTYDDPSLEKAVREFDEFEGHFFNLAHKLLPIATQMRDCQPFHDQGLAALVKALQPFAHPRARATDPRSEWHATAKLFASCIETPFRHLSLDPPKRGSARSPLVLAVRSLLDMLGLRVEAETIRKILCRDLYAATD
jgi:hypothetical protein